MVYSAEELAMLRADAETLMLDTCIISTAGAASSGPNPFNSEPTFSSPEIKCGYSVPSTREKETGGQRALIDGAIRLPHATVVNAQSRIKLIKLRGTTLSPSPVYAVIGEPFKNLAETVIDVKLVSGKSVL